MAAHKFYTEVLGFVSRTFVPEAYLAIVASPEEPNGTGLLLEPGDNPISISLAHTTEQPIPPSRLRPGLAPEWDAFVLKALSKAKEDRFDSAEAMRERSQRVPHYAGSSPG
jgi:hypothetical protein